MKRNLDPRVQVGQLIINRDFLDYHDPFHESIRNNERFQIHSPLESNSHDRSRQIGENITFSLNIIPPN